MLCHADQNFDSRMLCGQWPSKGFPNFESRMLFVGGGFQEALNMFNAECLVDMLRWRGPSLRAHAP